MIVDTNVLIHAANASSAEHEDCRRFIERQRRSEAPWFLTWGIAYEFLRVVTHPKVLRSPWTAQRAVSFLTVLRESPSCTMLEETTEHAGVLVRTVAERPALAGSVMHDVHTAVLMREHGVARIATLDAHFRRFPWVEVIDPRSDA